MENPPIDWDALARENETARTSNPPPHPPTLLTNVRIFNGLTFTPPRTLFFSNGLILPLPTPLPSTTTTIDCKRNFLLPGLLDTHIHPESLPDLLSLSRAGITTALSMSGLTATHNSSLKSHVGLTDIHVTGVPASSPNNIHTKLIRGWPMHETLTQPSEAADWVDRQLEKGAEYIKILADVPGLNQETVDALVMESKKRDKTVVVHAAKVEAVRQALKAGAGQIHHSPMDSVLTSDDIAFYKEKGIVNCPTLVMMRNFSQLFNQPSMDFSKALENVRKLHQAGVKILAGSDSTESKNSPAGIRMPFGWGLHEELGLLVQAGLSNVEALRAATVVPAEEFGFKDRGVVREGLRADLVLVREDPMVDIKAVRKIERVWIKGVKVDVKRE